MIKFICNFNNLLYLSFQLKKYLWNYFSTGFWSIFPYQVKVSRQKAYLKGKHGVFFVITFLAICMCAQQVHVSWGSKKVSSVHLKPESKADSSSYNYIFCIFGLKKYFDRRRFIDTKRFLPNYLFSHSPFWRVEEGVNFALTFVPKKKLKKKGTNLNHASSNQFHVTKI